MANSGVPIVSDIAKAFVDTPTPRPVQAPAAAVNASLSNPDVSAAENEEDDAMGKGQAATMLGGGYNGKMPSTSRQTLTGT